MSYPNHPGREGGGSLPRGTLLPNSSEIASQQDAANYWAKHFGNKAMSLTVHPTKQSRPSIEVKVFFDAKNDHAYTDGERDKYGKKTGRRLFSKNRAGLMWRLLSAIEYPTHVLQSGDGDLFIERITADQHYCVVLKHRNGLYNFASAHCYSAEDLSAAKRKAMPTRAQGTMKKSLTGSTIRDLFSTLQVFDHSLALKPANGWSGAVSSDPLRPLVKSFDPASSGSDEVSASMLLLFLANR